MPASVASAVPPAVSLASAAGGGSLLFRQLFDAATGTFTHLLADVASRKGLIIDPVFEQHDRDLSLIHELGIELVATLDTHVHADHITGSWRMREASGCGIGLAAAPPRQLGAPGAQLRQPAGTTPGLGGSHRDGLSRLDVRSAEEAAGHDGRMSRGLLIPLPELVSRLGECPATSPWWCSAIPAAAPPWPPSSCFRRAVRRWPTCGRPEPVGGGRLSTGKGRPRLRAGPCRGRARPKVRLHPSPLRL